MKNSIATFIFSIAFFSINPSYAQQGGKNYSSYPVIQLLNLYDIKMRPKAGTGVIIEDGSYNGDASDKCSIYAKEQSKKDRIVKREFRLRQAERQCLKDQGCMLHLLTVVNSSIDFVTITLEREGQPDDDFSVYTLRDLRKSCPGFHIQVAPRSSRGFEKINFPIPYTKEVSNGIAV